MSTAATIRIILEGSESDIELLRGIALREALGWEKQYTNYDPRIFDFAPFMIPWTELDFLNAADRYEEAWFGFALTEQSSYGDLDVLFDTFMESPHDAIERLAELFPNIAGTVYTGQVGCDECTSGDVQNGHYQYDTSKMTNEMAACLGFPSYAWI